MLTGNRIIGILERIKWAIICETFLWVFFFVSSIKRIVDQDVESEEKYTQLPGSSNNKNQFYFLV